LNHDFLKINKISKIKIKKNPANPLNPINRGSDFLLCYKWNFTELAYAAGCRLSRKDAVCYSFILFFSFAPCGTLPTATTIDD